MGRSVVRPQIASDDPSIAPSTGLLASGWSLQTRLMVFAGFWLLQWGTLLVLHCAVPGMELPVGRGRSGGGAAERLDPSRHVIKPRRQPGVLVGDDVVIEETPASSRSSRADATRLEFKVLEQRPDWLHIELNNVSGWIASDAEIVQALFLALHPEQPDIEGTIEPARHEATGR